MRYAAGDWRRRRVDDGSLVVVRRNATLGGQESYLPPRLLQGIIPSALLEAFRIWDGSDGRLRGEPASADEQWFNYRLEIDLIDDGCGGKAACVRRRARSARATPIDAARAAKQLAAQPLRREQAPSINTGLFLFA